MGRLTPRAWALAALSLLVAATALRAQQPARKPRPSTIDTLEARAGVDSNDAIVHYELAMGYWGAKRWNEADRALHQAVALAPQYAEAYLALSALPFARGERYWKQVDKTQGKAAVADAFQAGERYYRRAFLVNPMVELGILGRTDEGSNVRYGQTYFRIWWLGTYKQGINQFVDGHCERAYMLFDTVLKDVRAGTHGRGVPEGLLWYRGLSAAHLRRYDHAVEDFAILTGRAVADAGADSAAWDARLVTPFLARVRDRLGVRGDPSPAVRSRLGRILGSRAAMVCWGPEGGADFLVRNDGGIQASVPLFARLPELLAAPAGTR